ncbi:MAG: hypothetical protein ACREBI_02185 [Nitrosotalea sp.]
MAKVDPKKAKETFEKYLNEIKNFRGVPPIQGAHFRDELDEKICTLVKLSFDDAKEKLSHYDTTPHMPVTLGMSDEQIEKIVRNYHLEKLLRMEQYILGYVEELDLVMHTTKQTSKLDELEEEIREEQLEAKRRKAVVETKRLGAEIEIITELRNELKRKDETRKHIIELNSRVDSLMEENKNINKKIKSVVEKLEQMDSKLQKPIQQSNTIHNKSYKFEEDKWFEEIIQKIGNVPMKNLMKQTAKTYHANIKIIRTEIEGLYKQLSKTVGIMQKDILRNQINTKESILKSQLQNLAKMWSENS